MSRIDVLVATTSPDLEAEVIAEAVAARADMRLVGRRCVEAGAVEALLEELPASSRCAVVVVGGPDATGAHERRWLAARPDVVVVHVQVLEDAVRIALQDPSVDALLAAVRDLVDQGRDAARLRTARIALVPLPGGAARAAALPPGQPLLDATVAWVRELLRAAVLAVPEDSGDLHGFSVARASLLQGLDAPARRDGDGDPRGPLAQAEAALDRALLAASAGGEPLGTLARVLGEGGPAGGLEFRIAALAWAPELDLRFQRCVGYLLDDMSRRAGTLALYASLLGASPRIRGALARGGGLARWAVLEDAGGRPPAADEPLRLDPYLSRWLFGDRDALTEDPRVRRALRLERWPGSRLLQRPDEREAALELVERLVDADDGWLLLGGRDPAGWRAVVELGADALQAPPIRVEPIRLAGLDPLQIEETARLVARMARLTRAPLVVDAVGLQGGDAEDRWLSRFLAVLGGRGAAAIGADEPRLIRLLGPARHELLHEVPVSADGRAEAVRVAAAGADAALGADAAADLAGRYPIQVDGLEHAMSLARSRPAPAGAADGALARFTAACKDVAAEGVSHLADRLDPVFTLDEVVLPEDRKAQLHEIVDHVRLAPRVLDEWRFRDQLPFGRGVTALFFGASGTGKTMAAMGIARRLGLQLLRLDLSRVVSKYIGETEKNLDRVFADAQRSGSVILIDEADALLGKRSEVKDAHDRYANIEVAFLLQRMEAYEGLAILTTNLRKNLDAAFARRLRFIVDFPRPDLDARERIWRQCLPGGSHRLDDAAFRLLAKRIDLTGGHIRQITLRAAFIAAAASSCIALQHVDQAARAELAKLGMPPVDLDPNRSRRAA